MNAETVLAQVQNLAAKAEGLPQRLIDLVNQLISKVNSIIQSTPAVFNETVSAIAEFAQTCLEKIKEAAVAIADWFMQNIAPFFIAPYTLYTTGNKWTTDVFNRVSDVSGDLNFDPKESPLADTWQGPGSSAYQNIIPQQKSAVDKVGSMATTVQSTLQSLAVSLLVLYVSLVALLLWLLLKNVLAISAILTAIGIPPGLILAFESVCEFIAGAGLIYAALKVVVDSSLTTFGNLLHTADDYGTFPNGHWPARAADNSLLSDPTYWKFAG